MADFDPAFQKTLRHEGVIIGDKGVPIPGLTGYSNHPLDPGKETNYGITIGAAREHGYKGDMKDLPFYLARQYYYAGYWVKVGGETLKDQAIAEEMYDTAVNCGVATAVTFLQRTLNVLNGRGQRFGDITVDGVFGAQTLMALSGALSVAPYYHDIILRALDSLQCVRYIELAEKDDKFETFVPGWIRVRCGIIGSVAKGWKAALDALRHLFGRST